MDGAHASSVTIKLVIFDLDDTILVNTVPFAEMREKILKRIGVSDGPQHLYEFLRDMGEEYVALLEEEEIERAKYAHIHPFLPKLLDYLESHSIKKVVLTRNSRRATMLALGPYAQRFDCIITRDDEFEPKPSAQAVIHILKKFGIGKEQCLMVGDYLYDMQAGKSAGCITVCLGLWDADFHLKGLEDLIELIESLNQ